MILIYKHLNEKKFKFLTIINCFIADLFVCAHVMMNIGNKEQFDKTMDLFFKLLEMQMPGYSSQVSTAYLEELWQVVIMTLYTIILVYLLLHSVIYFFHNKDKKYAKSYVKFYSWSGAILMGYYSLSGLSYPDRAMFLIPSILLFVNAFGFKKFSLPRKQAE